jgi:hypothetical protein
MRKSTVLAALCLSLSAVACGNGNAKTVAAALMALQPDQEGAPVLAQHRAARAVAREMRDQAALTQLSIESHPLFNRSMTSCDPTSVSSPLGDCTVNCLGDKLNFACTYREGEKFTCRGTEYQLHGGTMAFSMGAAGSVFSMGFNFDLDLTADKKRGKLDCRMDLSLDMNDPRAGEGLECSDVFSCSFAGGKISCEDLQKEMENEQGC